jgi:spore germination protein GerM
MKKMLIILGAVLVGGILLGYGISWMSQKRVGVTENMPAPIVEELPGRRVQLYFTVASGTFLRAEPIEIVGCEEDRDCIRKVVEKLIQGPPSTSDLVAVLPAEAELLDVEIENDLVRLDFSQKLIDFHPGGSLTELLTLYSIANSLNENFPYLRQVQLLIGGEIKQTLKGHARIDQPIYADFSFCRPPAAGLDEENTDSGTRAEGLSIEGLIEQAEQQQEN